MPRHYRQLAVKKSPIEIIGSYSDSPKKAVKVYLAGMLCGVVVFFVWALAGQGLKVMQAYQAKKNI